MIMEPKAQENGLGPHANGGGGSSIASSGQPHTNLDELVSLLRNEIPEGRQTLLDTQSNLEKVADYCTSAYLDTNDKRAAFEKTKNYTTHSLASVAYQVNTLAYNILHMLDLQTNQIAEMESQLNYITQKVDFHKEKVARREVALLTSAKTSGRQPKVLAPANKEKQGKYIRKPIDFSLLDDIGHGVKIPNSQSLFRTSSSSGSTGRLSGIQTLGPKSSMNSLSHYHHYNTLTGGSGPAPTTKPPTPPQAVRSNYGTLSRAAANKEYRALAPPIAPPQVPKNYEPNYPIGHPKNPLTGQRSGAGNYSTLPHGASQQQYGMGQQQQHYGYAGNGLSSASLNSNSSGQYGQAPGMHPMSGHVVAGASTPPPPPPPNDMMAHDTSLPDPPPPPHLQHQHSLSSQYDSRNTTSSPPLPPPPPPVNDDTSDATMHHPQPQHPLKNQIYGISHRQNNLPDWVPPNYLEKVIAIYDYMADKDDELSFQENSVIYVTRKNDDGWYEGIMNGVTGLFPGNYVEPCL